MASPAAEQPPQSVRFSDVNQEIEPETAIHHVADLTGAGEAASNEPLSPQAEQELRNLSSTLQNSRVQAKRMENFSFEPVSLPPSRVSKSFHVMSNIPLTLHRLLLHRLLLAQLLDNPPNTAHPSINLYNRRH